jgi:hypothetical protein
MEDISIDLNSFSLDPFLQGVSLIVGKPISGKSLFLKFLAENAVRLQYTVGILDPNGDHADLSVVDLDVFGGQDALPNHSELLQMLNAFGTGFVLDLSALGEPEKSDYLNSALKEIIPFIMRTERPSLLIVDEAHGLSRTEVDLYKFEHMHGLCFSSFIPSGIATPIITSVTTFVVNKTSFEEVKKLRGRVRNPLFIDTCLDAIQKLSSEDAFAIISEGLKKPATIKFSTMIRQMKSRHIRQKNLFWSGYLPKEYCFYFLEPDSNSFVKVNNMQEFSRAVETISADSLLHHLSNHDLSRWAEDAIGDHELACQFAVIESEAESSSIRQIRNVIRAAVESRYAPSQLI